MAKIVVFDSGLGSLSIIKPLQKITKSEIIYFADQKNFPYGNKSKSELRQIINNTIKNLKETFHPDFIIVGSNTPTLMLEIEDSHTVGIKPPLKKAAKMTKTNNIGILATSATVKSKGLTQYIKECKFSTKYIIKKIDASELVKLVESGQFLNNEKNCKKIIKENLENVLRKNKIDVCTLSSTHLPFLYKLLKEIFPDVSFIDPANKIGQQVAEKLIPSERNSLKIFSSGNVKQFENNLKLLGITKRVTFLSF